MKYYEDDVEDVSEDEPDEGHGRPDSIFHLEDFLHSPAQHCSAQKVTSRKPTERKKSRKGMCVFVESDGKSERAKTAEQPPNPATPHPSSPHPRENLSVKMSLNAREILPCQLKQRWGEMYTEGTSLPRKFSLEMAPLIPGSHSNRIAYMIFEMSATGEATAEGVEVELFQGMLSPNLRPN